MSNVAIEDRINQPNYYHREYENDLKGIKPKSTLFQKAERVGIIALPFISLYKPLGSVISLGMNSTRSFSCLMQTKEALTKGEAKEIGIALFQSTLAATAVVGTIFGNFYGMAITSGHDVLISLYETLQFLNQGDYEKAFENFLQLANNSLYLTMLLHGSLEIVVLSFVAQILVEVYKSQDSFRKFKNGDVLDILEGIAHLGMAGIRGYQMQPQLNMLQFKWEIQKMMKEQIKRTESQQTASSNSIPVTANTVDSTGGASSELSIPTKISEKIGANNLENISVAHSDKTENSELADLLIKYGNLNGAVSAYDFHAVEVFLGNKAVIKGDTLSIAINKKNLDIADLLIKYGADPQMGVNAAALQGWLDGLNFLKNHGAKLIVNQDILAECISRNISYDILKLLIESGSDVKGQHFKSVVVTRQNNSQHRRRRDEEYHELTYGILVYAVKREDPCLVKLLIEKGAEINNGTYPYNGDHFPYPTEDNVYNQFIMGNTELIRRGKEGIFGFQGINPLSLAALSNNYEITALLLKNGAKMPDVIISYHDSGDGKGKALFYEYSSILSKIVDKGDLDKRLIPLLLENNHPDLIPREQNYTALQYFILKQNLGEVLNLLEAKRDPNDRGDIGKTPIQIAIELKNKEIIDLLIAYGAMI